MSSNRPPKTSTPPAGSKPPLGNSSHPPRVSKPPNVFEAGKMPDAPPSKPPVVNAPSVHASVPPRATPSLPPGAASRTPSKPAAAPSATEAAKVTTPSMAPGVSGVARSNIFDAPSEPGLNAAELNTSANSPSAPAPNVLTELTRSLAALHASEEPTTPSAGIDQLLEASKAATEQHTKPDPAAAQPLTTPDAATPANPISKPDPAAPEPNPSAPALEVPALPPQAPPLQVPPLQVPPLQAQPPQQAPIQQAPIQQAPVQQAPVHQTPVQQAPVQPNAVHPLHAAAVDPRAVQAPAPVLQASYAAAPTDGFTPGVANTTANAGPPAAVTKPKVLAPTLVIYGSAFWTYLVLGELVVRLDFPERLAFAALLGIFVRHCYSATERATYKGALQRFVPGVFAVLLWLVTLFLSASVLGTSSRSSVAAVTLLLWFFAIAIYSIGRILSDGPPPTEPKLTWSSGKRWWKLTAWVVSLGFTAVALLSAFDAA